MPEPITILAIVLMASTTYFTRIAGYFFLRNRTLSPRLVTVMQSAPGCVLISVIAPDFVTGRPADLIALAITIVAATRLPILPTVIIAILSAGILRALLP